MRLAANASCTLISAACATGIAPDKTGAGPDAANPAPGLCANPTNGPLLTFDFSGALGSQASTAPSSSAAGITAGALTRSPTLTAVVGSGSINASDWTTSGSRDDT